MLHDIKKTSKHSAVYALGNIATKIIGLILIPLYTDPKYLSQADFGALAVLEATSQLLIGLLTMAMIQSLTRWYWDKKYEGEQKSIFFTTLLFLIVTVIPVLLVLIGFSEPISMLLFQNIDYSILLKLTIGAAGLQVLSNQILCLAKVQSRSVLYSTVQIVKLSLILGLILYGIIIQGQGLEAIWWANLIGEAVTVIALSPYAIRNIALRFKTGILKEMLAYGFPLMLASISGVLLAVTDRYMLSSMSGLEDTGIYSLGYKIANTLKLVISMSLGLALSPLKMKKMNESDNHHFYSKVQTYSALVFSIGLLGLSLFSLEGIKLFTGSMEYWEANGIIPIIGYSLFFGLLKDNAYIGLSIKKKSKIIGMVIFVASVLNIVLNLILIPLFDIYGAAVATLLSQLFLFYIVHVQAQKAYKIPYELRKVWVLILVSGLFVVFGLLIVGLNAWFRIPIKLVLLFIFPFVLHLFRFYDDEELILIQQIKTSGLSFIKFLDITKIFK